MKLYNTHSKQKETLNPLSENNVTMYNCGPTVYGFAHIGNFASFLFADFLRRALEYNNYTVAQIMNITDVGHLTSDSDEGEDKIIKKAREEGKTPEEIARFFEDAFHKDAEKLNILKAQKFPRATEHIQEMIQLIEKLLKNNHAYEKDGNVYFDIESFENYGSLSGNTLENLKNQAREEVTKDPNKKNPNDFVLWFKAPENHLMKWESPWSLGYPGWHLECSAMAQKYLGETIDIHTGGEDHIFPHHEAEIAQSESATGQTFANIWMHKKHILVDGEKMSKSKGNIYTLKDLEAKNFHPLIYRFFIFTTHYRKQAQFSFQNLESAKTNLDKIANTINRLKSIEDNTGTNLEAMALIEQIKPEFEEALSDDLNTPQATAILHSFITDINSFIDQNKINSEEAQNILNTLQQFDSVIGALFDYAKSQEIEIPKEIQALANQREQARKNKNFEEADLLREKIENAGFEVEDTANGQRLSSKK